MGHLGFNFTAYSFYQVSFSYSKNCDTFKQVFMIPPLTQVAFAGTCVFFICPNLDETADYTMVSETAPVC
jgi:hypothetical protein